MSEDLPTRFIAYGWNVLRVGDANDVEAGAPAFQDALLLFLLKSSLLMWGRARRSVGGLLKHVFQCFSALCTRRGLDSRLLELQKRVRH